MPSAMRKERPWNANTSIRAIKLDELEREAGATRKANARAELEKRREHLMQQRTDGTKMSDSRARDELKKQAIGK